MATGAHRSSFIAVAMLMMKHRELAAIIPKLSKLAISGKMIL